MKGREISLPWPEVEDILKQIDHYSHLFDCYSVRNILLNAPLGYNPMDKINDLVWNIAKSDYQESVSVVNNRGAGPIDSAAQADQHDTVPSNVVPISRSPKKQA
jgi:hypothetical protein